MPPSSSSTSSCTHIPTHIWLLSNGTGPAPTWPRFGALVTARLAATARRDGPGILKATQKREAQAKKDEEKYESRAKKDDEKKRKARSQRRMKKLENKSVEDERKRMEEGLEKKREDMEVAEREFRERFGTRRRGGVLGMLVENIKMKKTTTKKKEEVSKETSKKEEASEKASEEASNKKEEEEEADDNDRVSELSDHHGQGGREGDVSDEDKSEGAQKEENDK